MWVVDLRELALEPTVNPVEGESLPSGRRCEPLRPGGSSRQARGPVRGTVLLAATNEWV